VKKVLGKAYQISMDCQICVSFLSRGTIDNYFMNLYAKKKNYFVRNVIISLVGLALFMAVMNFFEQPIKNAAHVVSAPMLKSFWQAGASSSQFLGSFFSNGSLQAESSNLKQENAKLAAHVIALQGLVRQTQTAAEFSQNVASNLSGLQVQVIGLDEEHDIATLNAGSAQGIVENMPVVSGHNVLYGKILKVYKNFSTVALISNSLSALDVKIQTLELTTSAVRGVIKGSGKLGIYLDLISLNASIQAGDILATSALDGIYPKDLLVGKIVSVNKDDAKPFQTASAQPFFDIKTADNLFVITDYKR